MIKHETQYKKFYEVNASTVHRHLKAKKRMLSWIILCVFIFIVGLIVLNTIYKLLVDFTVFMIVDSEKNTVSNDKVASFLNIVLQIILAVIGFIIAEKFTKGKVLFYSPKGSYIKGYGLPLYLVNNQIHECYIKTNEEMRMPYSYQWKRLNGDKNEEDKIIIAINGELPFGLNYMKYEIDTVDVFQKKLMTVCFFTIDKHLNSENEMSYSTEMFYQTSSRFKSITYLKIHSRIHLYPIIVNLFYCS